MKLFCLFFIMSFSLNLKAQPSLQEVHSQYLKLVSDFKSCNFCQEARNELEKYSENMTPELLKMSKGNLSVSQIKELFNIVLSNINSYSEDNPNIVMQIYLANRDKFETIVKNLAESDRKKIIDSLEDGFESLNIPNYKENYARFKKIFSK